VSDHGPSLPSSGVGVSGQFILSTRAGDGGKMPVPGRKPRHRWPCAKVCRWAQGGHDPL